MIIFVFKNKVKVTKYIIKQELLVDFKTENPKHKILGQNSKKISKRRTCLEIQENKKP